jgi:hypothetical protein
VHVKLHEKGFYHICIQQQAIAHCDHWKGHWEHAIQSSNARPLKAKLMSNIRKLITYLTESIIIIRFIQENYFIKKKDLLWEILSSCNFKPRVLCDQQCKLKANDAYREDKHWICHGNVDRQLDRFNSLLGCGAASFCYWRPSSSDVAPDPRRMESSSALRKRKNSRNWIIYWRQQIANKFGKCNNRWNVHLFCRKLCKFLEH